jgi:hypothetical protein
LENILKIIYFGNKLNAMVIVPADMIPRRKGKSCQIKEVMQKKPLQAGKQ